MESEGYYGGSLLLCIAALEKIVMIDNLDKRGMFIVNCCCMCKRNSEYVDHLLLHCPIVMELWELALIAFGIKWVMPKTVKGVLQSLWRRPDSFRSRVWNIVPRCNMEGEENRFFGYVASILQLFPLFSV